MQRVRVPALPNLETTTDKEDLISQVIGATWSCAEARPPEEQRKSAEEYTVQLHAARLQAHPAAVTLNEVPNNGYPISKSSEHSSIKSYTLYRQSYPSTISTVP